MQSALWRSATQLTTYKALKSEYMVNSLSSMRSHRERGVRCTATGGAVDARRCARVQSIEILDALSPCTWKRRVFHPLSLESSTLAYRPNRSEINRFDDYFVKMKCSLAHSLPCSSLSTRRLLSSHSAPCPNWKVLINALATVLTYSAQGQSIRPRRAISRRLSKLPMTRPTHQQPSPWKTPVLRCVCHQPCFHPSSITNH